MRAGERTNWERRLRRLERDSHPPVPIEGAVEEVLMRHGLIPRPPHRVRCPGCGEPSDLIEKNGFGHVVSWYCTRCDMHLAPEP